MMQNELMKRNEMGSADYHPSVCRLAETLNLFHDHNRGQDMKGTRGAQAPSPQQQKAVVDHPGLFSRRHQRNTMLNGLLTQPHAKEMHRIGCHSSDKVTTVAKYMAQRKLYTNVAGESSLHEHMQPLSKITPWHVPSKGRRASKFGPLYGHNGYRIDERKLPIGIKSHNIHNDNNPSIQSLIEIIDRLFNGYLKSTSYPYQISYNRDNTLYQISVITSFIYLYIYCIMYCIIYYYIV